MKTYLKVLRFIEIDLNYLLVKLPIQTKVKNIFFADFITLVNFLTGKSKFAKASFNGYKIMYDTPFSTKTFLTSAYDFFMVTNRLSIFKGNPFIIDIGANIGQFLFAAKVFLPKAKVISIEPDSSVFKLLEKNCKKMTTVELNNVALSDKNGVSNFYISRHFSEWSSLKYIKGSKKIKVKTIKGDNLFKEYKKINLIKIDVEGAELEVIKGMIKTIKKTEYLLVEISLARNQNDPGSSKLLKLLINNNFFIFSIGRKFEERLGGSQGAVDILFRNRAFIA